MNIRWYKTPRHRITDKEARRVRELSEQGYLPSAIAWEMPQLTLRQIKYQIYGKNEHKCR